MIKNSPETNRLLLVKGIKTLGLALVALFMGPTLLYIALTNKEKPLYIPIQIVAYLVCALAILLIYRGIRSITKSIF